MYRVEWLVVDESDKLFEEGKTGFRDQLATIYKSCDSGCLRRAMFSATFAHDVEEWCKLNLDNVIQVYVGAKNVAADSVKQELVFVGSEAGKLIAIRDIIRKGIQPPVLVFVQSKERAKELFHELIYDDINVDVIHADRPQLQRDNVVTSFRLGKIWVLICTELMGRGIDFKGVNLVVNYDFPNSAVSYIHRIGRTGRAGREGRAVTFFTEEDALNLRSIANVMQQAGCPVPAYMLKIGRPTQKARKKLAKFTPRRDSIRTLPSDDSEKAKKMRKLKKRSKAKQHKGTPRQGVSAAPDTTLVTRKGNKYKGATDSGKKKLKTSKTTET
ncbi:putative ATP-dependent RNA helicase DDX52 [Lamellibrachia satsuma]|nr:putative ATP-dependent RNA helicase DDX52 [Lamellibrachia satsuma]